MKCFTRKLYFTITKIIVQGGVERSPIASGRRFMTDLLVLSLMVDGGLQVCFNESVIVVFKQMIAFY
jgi:hypothetical protein